MGKEPLQLVQTPAMKRDIRALAKSGRYDLRKLRDITNLLQNREPIPPEYKDHTLHGDKEGYRDLHIQGDWVLIYRILEDRLILEESRTGTHAKLFP